MSIAEYMIESGLAGLTEMGMDPFSEAWAGGAGSECEGMWRLDRVARPAVAGAPAPAAEYHLHIRTVDFEQAISREALVQLLRTRVHFRGGGARAAPAKGSEADAQSVGELTTHLVLKNGEDLTMMQMDDDYSPRDALAREGFLKLAWDCRIDKETYAAETRLKAAHAMRERAAERGTTTLGRTRRPKNLRYSKAAKQIAFGGEGFELPNLVSLHVNFVPLGRVALSARRFPRLRSLRLEQLNELAEVRFALPQLEELTMDHLYSLDARDLARSLAACPGLRRLSWCKNYGLGGLGPLYLPSCEDIDCFRADDLHRFEFFGPRLTPERVTLDRVQGWEVWAAATRPRGTRNEARRHESVGEFAAAFFGWFPEHGTGTASPGGAEMRAFAEAWGEAAERFAEEELWRFYDYHAEEMGTFDPSDEEDDDAGEEAQSAAKRQRVDRSEP